MKNGGGGRAGWTYRGNQAGGGSPRPHQEGGWGTAFLRGLRNAGLYFSRFARTALPGAPAPQDDWARACIALTRFVKSYTLGKPGDTDHRVEWARAAVGLPGIADEYRMILARAAGIGADSPESSGLTGLFVLDRPVAIPQPWINKICRDLARGRKINRVADILEDLFSVSADGRLDNGNLWSYLYLCRQYRVTNSLVYRAARRLESAGWWADPVVRMILRNSGGMGDEKGRYLWG
jgi:hypothetical protein